MTQYITHHQTQRFEPSDTHHITHHQTQRFEPSDTHSLDVEQTQSLSHKIYTLELVTVCTVKRRIELPCNHLNIHLCITDIDECTSSPCQNGATCNNGRNLYTCSCAAGFYGTYCERGNELYRSLPVTLVSTVLIVWVIKPN